MRIPVDWLNEYVPNDLSVKDLADTLTDVGLEVEAIQGVAGAAVLDIKVTPNRGDCLSVLGVARELAMALRSTVHEPPSSPIEETGPPVEESAAVEIEDPALCPRYSARVLRKVALGPSPEWAQRRLEQCGLRPINNVVDATNLVMLELGQPLHAFDYALLGKADDGRAQIIVRRARRNERLTTIDGEERALPPEALVIADPSGPVALAGIMGGAHTEIHAGTTEVLLESAHFDPLVVRRGARALGMSTEASYRFERVVDPAGTVRALDRTCELIAEFSSSPPEIARGVVDVYPSPYGEREISLRPARVCALLGIELSADEIADLLRLVHLRVEAGDPIEVWAPTFRQDLREEIDLVEEVARAHGYRNIPARLPRAAAGVGKLSPELAFERKVRNLMLGMGLSEAVTPSLEGPEDLSRLSLPEDDPRAKPIVIANAKTIDRSRLRTTLMTSLLNVTAANRRHGVSDVSLFDLGRVFLPARGDELPVQPQHLGIAASGRRWRGEWALGKKGAAWDFYALKAVVETVVSGAARRPAAIFPDERPPLRPGRCARCEVDGRAVGWLGEVEPRVRKEFDLPDPVYLAELDLDALRAAAGPEPTYEAVSRFPAMTRDVAFIAPRDIPALRAEEVIRAAAGPDLESVTLFDAYEGKPLAKGERNLAFSLAFRRRDRTLTDAEVEEAMNRVRAALREQLGAQIRE